jgi:TPR repeat protein
MKQISPREFNAATTDQFTQILSGAPQQAAQWLYTAAEHGVVEAQVRYAQMLLEGIGVSKNADEAFQWFKLAAHQDHAMAMNMVGRCYENGWGVKPDMLLATYWFRLAARRGIDWGMYNYATSLALGRGVEMNRREALAWLRKATQMGHVKSWNLLGGFYEDGWEVAMDMNAALGCYQNAAEGGDFRGQFNYARLLAASNNTAHAMEWFKRAYQSSTAAFQVQMRQFFACSEQIELKALLHKI